MLTSLTKTTRPGLGLLLLAPRTLQGVGLRAALAACPDLPLLETTDAAARRFHFGATGRLATGFYLAGRAVAATALFAPAWRVTLYF